MVVNNTGLTNISRFDSTLSDDACQRLETHETLTTPDNNSLTTFVSCLIDNDVISEDTHIHKRLTLHVDTTEQNEHSLTNYDSEIATATYTYDPHTGVAYVGLVIVDYALHKRGYGTQMKKHVNNHIQQDGAHTAYTWIGSEGGEQLAKKTGYCPNTDVFADVPEIWSRSFE